MKANFSYYLKHFSDDVDLPKKHCLVAKALNTVLQLFVCAIELHCSSETFETQR